MADYKAKEENTLKSLSLSYLDSDDEENVIDDPINLLNAFRYA